MRYLKTTALLFFMSLLIALSCSASRNKAKDDNRNTSIVLLQASKEAWTAGHRSGGRGADFRISVLIPQQMQVEWESLETGNRTLMIRKFETTKDTCTLSASWLSNTDEKYAHDGVPDFQFGLLHYKQGGIRQSLAIPAFENIQSPPRP